MSIKPLQRKAASHHCSNRRYSAPPSLSFVIRRGQMPTITLLLASLGVFYFMMIAWIVIVFGRSAAAIHRVDLRRLDRKLDALLKHQDNSLPPVVSEKVQRILRDPKKKDEAIKLHGEQTALDVKDATADVAESWPASIERCPHRRTKSLARALAGHVDWQ